MWTDPARRATAQRVQMLALIIGLAGCGGATSSVVQPSASARPTATPATTESPMSTASPAPSGTPSEFGSDLDRLLEALERSHPEPFHGIPREDFVAALDAYEESLPELTPDEAVVGLMRVVAMLSAQGRDGHQFAFPQSQHAGPVLPIRVYEFAEGVHITVAAAPLEAIVGARIIAINGTSMDDVLDMVEPLVPRDGPATVPAFRPILMLRSEVLRGLGIIDDGVVRLDLERPDGSRETVDIEPIPLAEYNDWAGRFGMYQLPIDARVRYLADDETFSASLLDDGTAYLRYRFIAPPTLDEVRAWIGAGQVNRLVVDLRQNPGGDNNTFRRLLALVVEFAEAHPGATTVLTDRVTFSAAANLATSIEQATDARFVGEPMGGGLNFWDDVYWVRLDELPIPMQVAVSYRHWVFAAPDDPRLTIEPDIPIEVTAADYFGGRDPALEAALTSED